jgi:uncharacterized protein (DUF3084 family)
MVADWKDLYDQSQANFERVKQQGENLRVQLEAVTAERDHLRAEVQHLKAEVAGWQFDPDDEIYPEELDIAMQIWRAVTNSRAPGSTPKQQALKYLEQRHSELSHEARERIAKVCNWGKRGGRPS